MVKGLAKCPNQKLVLTLNWLSLSYMAVPTSGQAGKYWCPNLTGILFVKGTKRLESGKLSKICTTVFHMIYFNFFHIGTSGDCSFFPYYKMCVCMWASACTYKKMWETHICNSTHMQWQQKRKIYHFSLWIEIFDWQIILLPFSP